MKQHVTSIERMAIGLALLLGTLSVAAPAALAADSPNPFIGNWALTIPGGAAGWLGIVEKDGQLTGSILWGGGSVVPVDGVKIDGNTLVVTRISRSQPRGGGAATVTTETITATLAGDDMKLTTSRKRQDGTPVGQAANFTGKRTPPLPPRPDLSKVKFGDPITLFNGKDLEGWRLVERGAANGWSVKDGVLSNNPVQDPAPAPHKNYGNLRTDREFEDFNITLEAMVTQGQNSGVYLRGIYECQVADTYGKPVGNQNMGAIYSRLLPTEAAEKPAGQWQSLDITLVDRHATVILNGKKIIDNQPLLGCTGGALWSDQFKPGPIYLQGDHSSVSYRNIVLRPVVK